MSYAKGTVLKIKMGEPKDGQYGKSAKFGMQVKTDTEEKWYNGFASEDKYSHQCLIKDKNNVVVKEGDEVEFMAEGEYNNIDKKTLKVLSDAVVKPANHVVEVKKEDLNAVYDVDASIRSNCLKVACDSFNHVDEEKRAKFSLDALKRIAEDLFNYCKHGL